MSLETQIAALVEAANSLTGSVNGKMNQIDQKVDAATASVPNSIREAARAEYHVNSITGTDSSTVDGKQGSPFKTILYAIERALPGAEVVIFLEDGSEHICEVPEHRSHHHSSNGKNIYIRTRTSSVDESGFATLIFRGTGWPGNPSNQSRCNFFEGSDFGVAFKNIKIKMENATGLPLMSSGFGGLFTRGSGNDSEVTRFHLMFRACILELNGKLGFVTTYGGSVAMAAHSTRLRYEEGVTSPILPATTVKTLGMGSVTLENVGTGPAMSAEDILGFDIATSATSIYI